MLDVKLTPYDSNELGAGLFDSPAITFLVEIAIFFSGLWVYTTFLPVASKIGYQNSPNMLKIVSAITVIQQAHFCFGS